MYAPQSDNGIVGIRRKNRYNKEEPAYEVTLVAKDFRLVDSDGVIELSKVAQRVEDIEKIFENTIQSRLNFTDTILKNLANNNNDICQVKDAHVNHKNEIDNIIAITNEKNDIIQSDIKKRIEFLECNMIATSKFENRMQQLENELLEMNMKQQKLVELEEKIQKVVIDVEEIKQTNSNLIKDIQQTNSKVDETVTENIKHIIDQVKEVAVQLKEVKEAYNSDLLRVERSNRDAMDSVAADLVKNINDLKSDTLGTKLELVNMKENLDMVSNEISDIKEYVERSVLTCD
jgi:hypothetical protein